MSELDLAGLLYRARQDQPVLDWNAITEPGCYLHVTTGLLARVFPEDLGDERALVRFESLKPMAKLSSDPRSPVATLRAIASRHGYSVGF